MKKIFLFCFMLLVFQKIHAQISGVRTIPGDYVSITAALEHIQMVGISGPVFLELQVAYNSNLETFPIKLREIPGVSAINPIVISPAANASHIGIISTTSGAIIEFIGAHHISIDGRPGRTGSAREILIRNHSTTGRAIGFLDGAVSNSVTYCMLEGSASSSLSNDITSVVYFGRSTESIPANILLENFGNTISSCSVMGINSPHSIIHAPGISSVHNSFNIIIDNEILNFWGAGIWILQDGGSNWTITGNSIYNQNPNASQGQLGIYFQPGPGSINNTISGNFIGGQALQAGGGQWVIPATSTASMGGIAISAGSVAVENNTIQNIRVESSAQVAEFHGISISSTTAAQIRGNLIGGTTEINGIQLDAYYYTTFRGIYSSSCSQVTIENNTISNITLQGSDPSSFKGIESSGGSTIITGNQVDPVTANSTMVDFIAIEIVSNPSCPAPVFGVKTIPGDYATITAAIQHLTAVGVSGPVFIELQSGYNSANETFPIRIGLIPGVSAVNSITISPAAGVTGTSIISPNSGAVIELIGAHNITIDGRPGRTGTARELTIRSNSTTGRAISFVDGAIENSVTHCNLEGSASFSFPDNLDANIVYFGRSTEPGNAFFENLDNAISNCIIKGLNSPRYIIYAPGIASVHNAFNKIIDNEILNFRGFGIRIAEDGGSNWTITGNSLYNLDPNIQSGLAAIWFQPGPGSFNNTISGNFIGGQASQAGGEPWVFPDISATTSMVGIVIEAGGVVVENNTMQNIKVESSTQAAEFTGILIYANTAAQIRGNLIGGTTETNGIILDGAIANFNGISNSSCYLVSIENNRISNITTQALTTRFRGIGNSQGSSTIIAGNQIDQVTVNSTGPIDFIAIAIENGNNCPYTPQPSIVDHNIINNITLSVNDGDASFTGMEITDTSSVALQLHNNEIYRINVSSSNATANFTGLSVNDRLASNTGNTIGSATEANSIVVAGKFVNATAILVNKSPDASISDDIIGNITVNGTLSASLNGIRFQDGGVGKVSGNQLSDLSVSSPGPADMVGIGFYGLVVDNEASTLHNNQVYRVNVASSNATANFTGLSVNDRLASNTGNVIGSATEANSIMVTGNSAFAYGIRLNNSPDVSISDDIIANITANGTLVPATVNGIFFGGGAFARISGNQLHHLSAPESKGILIQPSGGSSTVTLEKNILTGTTTNEGIGIETLVSSGTTLNLTATDNTISNWQTGVLLAAASGAGVEHFFQNNTVADNQTGFINQSSAPANATCNWWGDASGPSGAGTGTGNPVGPNVNFTPWARVPEYVAVNAGSDQTIYVGYGPSQKTLTPEYTVCGTPTYLWSTGATSASITVSPVITTEYLVTITDANGHEASDAITVFVEDVRCGNKKVLVCHNASKGKRKTLCISINAVAAHLAHGDVLGECGDQSAKNPGSLVPGEEEPESISLISVYPNPASNHLQLQWKAETTGATTVTVKDMEGRSLYSLTLQQMKGNNFRRIQLPALRNGSYFLLMQSQEGISTLKFLIQH